MGKKSATPNDNADINVDSDPLDNHHVWIDDSKEFIDCLSCLAGEDCYLNIPSNMEDKYPLDMDVIKEQQLLDKALQPSMLKYADCYTMKCIGAVNDIVCYVKPGDNRSKGK